MSAKIEIQSDTPAKDINRSFHIVAGPGAGKTHWLTQHIIRVIRTSDRLRAPSKVACISYTNVAIGELNSRLGTVAHSVEASTIHSFLYRNLVRPYLHFIKDESGQCVVRHDLVDGHDEHRPSHRLVMEWLTRHKRPFSSNPSELFDYLKTLHWKRNDKGGWVLESLRPYRPNGFLASKLDINNYKRVYWEEGIIDHDDVLYFAARLIEEHPALAEFLAARFPYLFIDEFQDTNPIQSEIVMSLAQSGAVIGVIGDGEQSIFGFQGASREKFLGFSLANMDRYCIVQNRRSTKVIIDSLNALRRDGLQQKSIDASYGKPVQYLVGQDASAHFAIVRRELGDDAKLIALAWKHDELRAIRNPSAVAIADMWKSLEAAGVDRYRFLVRIARATSLAEQARYGPAIREAIGALRVRSGTFAPPVQGACTSDTDRRGLAVTVVGWLGDNMTRIKTMSTLEVYMGLHVLLQGQSVDWKLQGVTTGRFKAFATETPFGDLVGAVSVPEETRDVRTIHQAKGAEFDNVLVRFSSERELTDFLDINAPSTETDRPYYVALSRARHRLFLSIPSASASTIAGLSKIGCVGFEPSGSA